MEKIKDRVLEVVTDPEVPLREWTAWELAQHLRVSYSSVRTSLMLLERAMKIRRVERIVDGHNEYAYFRLGLREGV